MSRWESIELEKVVEFAPKVSLKKDSLYAFVGMEDINPIDRHVIATKTIIYDGTGGAKFTNDSILFARITPCLENRKIAQVKLGAHKAGIGSTEFLVFREKQNVSDLNFLYYLLKSNFVVENAINSMVGASGRQRADWQYLKGCKIPLPPLPTQRRIAEVLGRYDSLIENYQKQISLLEGMAQELYREWFVRVRCPYAEPGENGELPVGWVMVELGTLSETIQRGISPTYDDDGTFLCLNQRCIRDKSIDYSVGRQQSKEVSYNRIVKFGDVLINSTGEGTLGRTAQVYDHQIDNVTVDSHVTIARPKAVIPVEYYGFIVTNLDGYFESMAMGSTGQTELLREVIYKAKVLRPNEEAMMKFSNLITPMKNKIVNLQMQLNTLRQTRDALLPRLLDGQVKVEKIIVD